MKVLIVGGGSIGTRHLRNLRTLGVKTIAVADPDDKRRQTALSEGAQQVFANLDAGLDWQPTVALITSPSHLHIIQAKQAALRGCDLFIEKPLSHSTEGLIELATTIEQRGLISLVGCNMRFHPGPSKVKELLEQGAIGRILFARVHTGSYLPGWRPTRDYRETYSAQAKQGGGCILDCIHEIDLARWYLGEVTEVFCIAERRSTLEVDTEDVAMLLCRHGDGTLSEIHLDFVQRTYERGCQIVGADGSIFWDFREGSVRLFEAAGERWTTFPQVADFQVNQIYIDEMRHFLECVAQRRPTTLPVSEGVRVMALALAAKRSAQEKRLVNTGSVLDDRCHRASAHELDAFAA
jgi:predicted dehydrogenase